MRKQTKLALVLVLVVVGGIIAVDGMARKESIDRSNRVATEVYVAATAAGQDVPDLPPESTDLAMLEVGAGIALALAGGLCQLLVPVRSEDVAGGESRPYQGQGERDAA